MNRIRLVTPWAGNGTKANPFQPQLTIDHPLGPGESCTDVTGQPCGSLPPTPNLFTAEMVCSDATLANIQGDVRYAAGLLWSETT